MKKLVISIMLVVAVIFGSVINVLAVNDPSSSTATTETTEVVTATPDTVALTDTGNDIKFGIAFVVFAVAMVVGVNLGRAFSFWKW